MKLVVQIPCLNEENSIGRVVASIPRSLPGFDHVEVQLIDDGCTDETVARAEGIDRVVRHGVTRGLAASFRDGLNEALSNQADVIVNIDGDFQYDPGEIHALVEPIVQDRADMVIGDRNPAKIPHFSWSKRSLHWAGCRVICKTLGLELIDVTSGFRAFSRKAAESMQIRENFSYTIESLFIARSEGLRLTSVPVRSLPVARPSRLMKNNFQFVVKSTATVLRCAYRYRSPQ